MSQAYVVVDPQTIILLSERGRYEEAIAASPISPGYLIEKTSSGEVQPHASYGGAAVRYFALEDALQGFTAETTAPATGSGYTPYNAGDVVRMWAFMPGDLVYCRIPAGAVVNEGDALISDGAGHLITNLLGEGGGNLLFSQTAASAVLTNTTVETLYTTGYTIPAGFLRAGDVLRVRAQGIATAVNSTDTLKATLYIGGLAGTAIAATAAVNPTANDIFLIEATITIRTVGATGTLVATGLQKLGTPGTASMTDFVLGSTAINTTVAQQIAVSGKYNVANAGDSSRLDILNIELLRGDGMKIIAFSETTKDNSAGATEAFIEARVAG